MTKKQIRTCGSHVPKKLIKLINEIDCSAITEEQEKIFQSELKKWKDSPETKLKQQMRVNWIEIESEAPQWLFDYLSEKDFSAYGNIFVQAAMLQFLKSFLFTQLGLPRK